jgi:hypothetical protein
VTSSLYVEFILEILGPKVEGAEKYEEFPNLFSDPN